jgi:hypothetical protein
MIIEIPPTTNERPSTPIAAVVDVQPGRVHNPVVPLPVRDAPPLNGNPDGRLWGRWISRQPNGPGTPLYDGMPVLEQMDDGSWQVRRNYNKSGDTSELAAQRIPTKQEWGGGRCDAMFVGDDTVIGIPDTEGNNTWMGINPGGAMKHYATHPLHSGVIPICGLFVPKDAVIRPSGASKVLLGTFDRPFLNPNDLCIDEDILPAPPGTPGATFTQTVAFVADTGTPSKSTGRIAKVRHVERGRVEVTTFFDLTGKLPYCIARWPTGESLVGCRATGELLVVNKQGTAATVLASGFNEPTRMRRCSDESVLIVEWNGRKIWRVFPDGTKTDTGQKVTAKSGLIADTWFDLYVDRYGAQGPVDDYLAIQYGTSRNIQRRGLTDGFSSWLSTGSYSIRQGLLKYIQEIDFHYGWTFTGAPRRSLFFSNGDAGTSGVNELYFGTPAEIAGFDKFNATLYKRGATVWHHGTTPETGVLRSSGKLHMGNYGQAFVVGYTFEQITRKTLHEIAEWLRAGMGTTVPRPEITDADVEAFAYFAACQTAVPQEKSSLDPAVILEAGDPLPPPDTTGPVITAVTGWPEAPINPGETVKLTVLAEDPSGVQDVTIFIDGIEHETDIAAPWSVTFSRDLPDDYAVTIRARDTKGNPTITAPRTIVVELPPPPPQPDVTLILRAGLTHEVKQA